MPEDHSRCLPRKPYSDNYELEPFQLGKYKFHRPKNKNGLGRPCMVHIDEMRKNPDEEMKAIERLTPEERSEYLRNKYRKRDDHVRNLRNVRSTSQHKLSNLQSSLS